MGANADFMWRVCFDFYERLSNFLEAKMLASRSLDWFLYDNSLRHERVKVPLGEHFRIPYFTEKNS